MFLNFCHCHPCQVQLAKRGPTAAKSARSQALLLGFKLFGFSDCGAKTHFGVVVVCFGFRSGIMQQCIAPEMEM